MENCCLSIQKLVTYALETGLITQEDKIYTTNLLLDVMGLEEYMESDEELGKIDLESTLKELLDYAWTHGLLEENSIVYRDLFDTRLMNCLMPRPSEVVSRSQPFLLSLSGFPGSRD